ncbi:MAG: hypothetical protein ACO4CG_11160 [Prochlorothrix sp.]|nr:(2Fe-2S) ferredoxin domain-containing protein [Prochlorothrix sp.]
MAELWVCHNHTCRHQGAKAVFAALRREIDRQQLDLAPPNLAPPDNPPPGSPPPDPQGPDPSRDRPLHTVQIAGCLGHCGSGPMVIAVPGDRWFYGAQPEDAAAILHSLTDSPPESP